MDERFEAVKAIKFVRKQNETSLQYIVTDQLAFVQIFSQTMFKHESGHGEHQKIEDIKDLLEF